MAHTYCILVQTAPHTRLDNSPYITLADAGFIRGARVASHWKMLWSVGTVVMWGGSGG